jgi:hypothetical protein
MHKHTLKGGKQMKNKPTDIVVLPITEDDEMWLLELTMSDLIGQKCEYCGEVFETLESLKDVIRSHRTDVDTMAHIPCYKKHLSETEQQ